MQMIILRHGQIIAASPPREIDSDNAVTILHQGASQIVEIMRIACQTVNRHEGAALRIAPVIINDTVKSLRVESQDMTLGKGHLAFIPFWPSTRHGNV